MSLSPSLSSLQTKAGLAAAWRGHALGLWQAEREHARALASCTNLGCQAWVQVQVAPPPNGIDIGGPAVALNCPAPEQRS